MVVVGQEGIRNLRGVVIESADRVGAEQFEQLAAGAATGGGGEEAENNLEGQRRHRTVLVDLAGQEDMVGQDVGFIEHVVTPWIYFCDGALHDVPVKNSSTLVCRVGGEDGKFAAFPFLHAIAWSDERERERERETLHFHGIQEMQPHHANHFNFKPNKQTHMLYYLSSRVWRSSVFTRRFWKLCRYYLKLRIIGDLHRVNT